jgi:hypothetical protein
VTVQIVHYAKERAEARRVEYERIHRLRPIANLPFSPPNWLEWQIVTDEAGQRVATDAYVGRQILMTPDNRIFKNLTEATQITGISKSAICNSCSGRYPEVAGKQFYRIPATRR